MRILLGFWLVRPVLPHKIFRCAILAEAWSSHIHSMQIHLANAVTTASVAFPGYIHLPCIYIWWRCSEGAGGIWTILFDCVESVKLYLNLYRYGCIYVPPQVECGVYIWRWFILRLESFKMLKLWLSRPESILTNFGFMFEQMFGAVEWRLKIPQDYSSNSSTQMPFRVRGSRWMCMCWQMACLWIDR